MRHSRTSWDQALLARLLKDLVAVPSLDLAPSGFGEDEIAKLLRRLTVREKQDRPETFDLKRALDDAARTPPRARPGDLFLLGDHRLLCGDSTNPDDVARLMDGQQAALVATDPPYLVDYTGGDHPASRANHGRSTKDKHWDEYIDPEASVAFCQSFLHLALAHCREGMAVYQWHATRRQALVEQAWTAAGLLWHQSIVWVKPRAVLTHGHYLWGHEPCAYGWVAGKPPTQKPPADQSTVWQVAGEHDGIHPTQKPVELFLRPIRYHTEPGGLCYEPFAGSGSRLMAAERLGRRCYALEREPRYVDVIVARWEAFTGERAQKAPPTA